MTDPVSSPSTPAKGKTNDHLANDRTLLAWVRTSLGIMGLGFIVVKFSMFIRQLSIMMGLPAQSNSDDQLSGWIGIFLVGFGALLTVLAYVDYLRIRKQIDENSFYRGKLLMNVLIIGLIVISALLIWYLIKNRH